jgi:hypothetical protein
MVLYLSLAAEIPCIVLNQDQPYPLIEDKIEPQGHTKDAVARNANIEPFDIARVDALTIVCTNDNKIDEINDSNDDIMSVAAILPANNPNSLIFPDTLDDNNTNKKNDKSSNDDESSDNNLLQGGNLGTQGEIGVDVPEEDPAEGQDQGVHQSRHKNKETTSKYADYTSFMMMPNSKQEEANIKPSSAMVSFAIVSCSPQQKT